MKKSIVLFMIFLILDIILWAVVGNQLDYEKKFLTYYFPLIVIEIATYGSIIIYDINKKGDDKK